MTHAVILGATASLGKALCQELAKQNINLILFGRDQEALALLASDLTIRFGIATDTHLLDVTELEQVTTWETTILTLPPFDLVFSLVGVMPKNHSSQSIVDTINTNFTGPAVLLSLFVQKLQKQQNGKLVVVTSVAGDRGRQSNYLYGSAKAGLSIFAAGLRHVFWKHGIHVLIVKPGYIDTPMTYGMKSPFIASREYVARKIIRAVQKNQYEVYIPFFWKFILFAIKLIPETLFKRLSL